MNPETVLTAEGLAKASKNRTIFIRAVQLLQKEYGMSYEDVVKWLSDDAQFTEATNDFSD